MMPSSKELRPKSLEEFPSGANYRIQRHIDGKMMESLSKELSGIEIKMNRLLSQKAALKSRLKTKENSQRRARTRTLIQLGGLLNLTSLLSICGIELGDDLQLEHPDKAAMLLGILVRLSDQLPEQLSEEDLEKFRRIGVNKMKATTYPAETNLNDIA